MDTQEMALRAIKVDREIELAESIDDLQDALSEFLSLDAGCADRAVIRQALFKARDMGVKMGTYDAQKRVRDVLGL